MFFKNSPPRARKPYLGGVIIAGLLTALFLAPIAHKVEADDPTPQSLFGHGAFSCTKVSDHFGRMFPRLPSASWPRPAIDALATATMAEEEEEQTPEGQVDDEENLNIDAGFTYVGQFIDHDLTLDPRPNDLTTPIDPRTLVNSRTPAFDLDSVYGGGPIASPQLYQADHVHLKLGAPLTGAASDPDAVDLPRDANGQALLGDPRNDENRIVASLHAIMLRFHNDWVDRISKQHKDWSKSRVFEEARRQTRLYYQYAVLTDFLPTIVGRDVMRQVLPSMNARQTPPNLNFYNPCTEGTPVEFSVAAYRLGHSMVRPIYRINTAVADRLPVFSTTNDPTKDLGGFRPSPSNFGVDWSFFFLMNGQRVTGKPQSSYKLDNSLVFPLSLLPLPDTGSGPASLSERNLLRSVQLGLPSGQDVARAMGIRPLRDDQILIGKATGDAEDTEAITAVSPAFAGKAPLWTYILAESTAASFNVRDGHIVGKQFAPIRLGPVGARIVAEVFVGLMAVDRTSVLYDPTFHLDPRLAPRGQFGFKELIASVTN